MQTFLDTIHTAYVFYSRNSQFPQTEFWQKIIDILNPLTAKTTHPSTVIPGIYNTAKAGWVEFTDIQWNSTDLEKWTGNDEKNNRIERASVYFPSMQACYEEKITPDIFMKVSIKATEKEKRYEFVFMLVVKNDFLKNFNKTEVKTVLKELHSFLKPVFKVKKERPWAIKESDLQYGDALHDFFPSMILANGNDFIFRDGFQDWESFD